MHSTAADIETFLAEPFAADPSQSVTEFVKITSSKTGEAVNVKRVARFDAGENGVVGMYRHHNGKLATLVQVTASTPEAAAHEATQQLVKFIAEHIAAAAPLAVDRTGVPAETIESEKRIAEEQAREAGKPEAMIEKIDFVVDEEAEHAGYHKMTTLITIELMDGRTIAGRADFGKGSPDYPMSFDEVAEKFRSCAAFAGFDAGRGKEVVALVRDLEDLPSVARLTKALAQ